MSVDLSVRKMPSYHLLDFRADICTNVANSQTPVFVFKGGGIVLFYNLLH